jgi:hypothetical protein
VGDYYKDIISSNAAIVNILCFYFPKINFAAFVGNLAGTHLFGVKWRSLRAHTQVRPYIIDKFYHVIFEN